MKHSLFAADTDEVKKEYFLMFKKKLNFKSA